MRYLSLFLAAALVACASAGTKVDQSKVAAFQRGKTTYTEVITQLGTPNGAFTAADGSRSIVYMYTQVKTRPQSFIPLVGIFVAKADANSNVYTFTFGPDGVLKSYGASSSQATSGAGFGN
jgi:outer membrane protein assembly factor BamE (lipoprotein component of BamABCDE complex)